MLLLQLCSSLSPIGARKNSNSGYIVWRTVLLLCLAVVGVYSQCNSKGYPKKLMKEQAKDRGDIYIKLKWKTRIYLRVCMLISVICTWCIQWNRCYQGPNESIRFCCRIKRISRTCLVYIRQNNLKYTRWIGSITCHCDRKIFTSVYALLTGNVNHKCLLSHHG